MAASNVNVVVITGNLTQDPELRSTGGGTSVCELRVAVNSRRKDGRPANGSTSPTTSTSPSGARRARTAPTTSPRAARWRSKAGSTGASGRPKTAAANARRSRSSPTRSSSSAPATAPAAGGNGNGGGGFTPTSDVPADTSDFEGAAAGVGGGGGRRRHPVLACRPGAPRGAPGRSVACARRMARARETSSDNKRGAAAAAPTVPARASTRGSTPRSSTTRTSTCCAASSPTRGRPAAGASPDFPAVTSASSRWR